MEKAVGLTSSSEGDEKGSLKHEHHKGAEYYLKLSCPGFNSSVKYLCGQCGYAMQVGCNGNCLKPGARRGSEDGGQEDSEKVQCSRTLSTLQHGCRCLSKPAIQLACCQTLSNLKLDKS